MERWKTSQLNYLSTTADLDTAYRISLNFAKNIGFKFFGFSTSYTSNTERLSALRLNNYPSDWNADYEQRKLAGIDPVVAHCNQSELPILWSEELFANAPHLWDTLEQEGLQHGWSQAIHDDESGLFSILSLVRSHSPITALELYENLGASAFICHHLHRLVAQTLPKTSATQYMPQLSLREIDVLKLAADGKTAYESARILNLSPRTINFHVQEAIRKFEVNNKVSAVIAAAKAGYLNKDAAP
ncbi:autoinducer binding domain-containing protein [Pseudomonas moorei]|jgi:LuxR family transcriptional regulator|uniref:helix-turn-helix transcriptional regulator n=1 Tax=Pseudomonas moorei TaxID=395599 RepID=UPI0036F35277